MSIGLTIFLIFLGSLLLTAAAILLRLWLTGQRIASLADLVIATAAYEISLYTAEQSTRSVLIKGGTIGNALEAAGLWMVPLSVGIYVLSLRMGEFRWLNKNDLGVVAGGLHREFYMLGMIFGWLLPVAWMAGHLVVIFVEL